MCADALECAWYMTWLNQLLVISHPIVVYLLKKSIVKKK